MTAPMKRLMVTLANVVNLCVDEQKNKENSKIKKTALKLKTLKNLKLKSLENSVKLGTPSPVTRRVNL